MCHFTAVLQLTPLPSVTFRAGEHVTKVLSPGWHLNYVIAQEGPFSLVWNVVNVVGPMYNRLGNN